MTLHCKSRSRGRVAEMILRVPSPDSLRLRALPLPPWLGPQTGAEAPTDSGSKVSQPNKTAAFAWGWGVGGQGPILH